MNHIVVSYAGADRLAAGLVIGKLKKLGHTVTPAIAARKSRASRQANGSDVLVLWSRNYASTVRKPAPALATLRLDTAPPPPKAKTIDLRQWRGRDNHRGWRAVLATLAPATAAPSRAPSPVPAASAPEPQMKDALETKEYTGPQFIHLAVMVALLAGAGAWMWQFLPH
jgi:hypothetical protein